jgi:hypothetical protein
VGKSFSFNGTRNRPELGQGSESDTAPDNHCGPHRHFQKFLAGYILFAFHASLSRSLMRHFLAALICIFLLPAILMLRREPFAAGSCSMFALAKC